MTSLRETLSDAWDNHEIETSVDAPEAPEVAAEPEAPLAADADSAPVTESSPPVAAKSINDQKPEIGETTKGAEGASKSPDDSELIPPPISWSAEDRQVFAKLPKEAQAIVRRREHERDVYCTRLGQEKARSEKEFGEIRSVLEPYKNKFIENEISEKEAVQNLLAWQDKLDENPIGALRAMMSTYGIEPEALINAPANEYLESPHVLELKQQVEEMRSMLDGQYETAASQQIAAVNNEVSSFANAVDASGKRLHPYYAHVEEDPLFVSSIQILKQQNPGWENSKVLQEAYDRACWANPVVRADIQRKQQEGAQQVSTARRMGSSVSGAPGVASSGSTKKDLRSILEDAYNSTQA